jgi:hypothetical protein
MDSSAGTANRADGHGCDAATRAVANCRLCIAQLTNTGRCRAVLLRAERLQLSARAKGRIDAPST